MRQMWVHIGPHKTGTTALQLMLAHLRESIEIVLPTPNLSDAATSCAVNQLALEMMGCAQHPWWGTEVRTGRAIALAQELPHVQLLSAEEFSRFGELEIAELQRLLGNEVAVSIVVGVRSYDELSRSAWAQFLKAGVVRESLSDFQARFLREVSDPGQAELDAVPQRREIPTLRHFSLLRAHRLWSRVGRLIEFDVPTQRPLTAAADVILLERFLAALGLEVESIQLEAAVARMPSVPRNQRPIGAQLMELLNLNKANSEKDPRDFVQQRLAVLREANRDESTDAQEMKPNSAVEAELRELFQAHRTLLSAS